MRVAKTDPAWLKQSLAKTRLQHVNAQAIMERVNSGTDTTEALWDASSDLVQRADRRAVRGGIYKACAIGTGIGTVGAIGAGIYAGSWWIGLGGGLAGLVTAIVAGSAATAASDDSASMKAESVALRKLGYEARLAARAADQTPSPWQPAEVLRELSECGFEYFADGKTGTRLDPARAAERLQAGQEFYARQLDAVAVPVQTEEHLRFLDFMQGGVGPEGLSDPDLAVTIKLLCDKGERAWCQGDVGALPVYRAALGEPNEHLSFGDVRPITAENIRSLAYFRHDHECALADRPLAQTLKTLAKTGYCEDWRLEENYCRLTADPQATLAITDPVTRLRFNMTAADLRDAERLQRRTEQVERLYDTYIQPLRQRLGSDCDLSPLLRAAYQDGPPAELRERVRLLATLYEAELGTRVPKGVQDASARAEEDLAELHRCSQPDELLPRARVLGRLLGALPRQHALNAFRVARHPVGKETIEERADLFVEHMLQETFTVRDRELESAPRALARVYAKGYVHKAAARFSPENPTEAVERLTRLLDQDEQNLLGIDQTETHVVIGGVTVPKKPT
ncbi:MAG: hypothetical protein HY319_13230 [Armatimonadetes bacterium]|nr:hypothetical protein [Armatimonadota bacterium]